MFVYGDYLFYIRCKIKKCKPITSVPFEIRHFPDKKHFSPSFIHHKKDKAFCSGNPLNKPFKS